MKKYIDAEKLKGEIERLYDGEAPKHDQQCDFDDGYFTGISKVFDVIDSLQQEQPESSKGKFLFPNFLYARTVDNKTIDVSYAPQSLDAVEYIKNDPTEQPEVDLEKEIERWWGEKYMKNSEGLPILPVVQGIAHHFAEWQKEQMMKDAVEADVNIYRDLAAGKSWAEFVVEMPTNNLGDKVRIIILPKED